MEPTNGRLRDLFVAGEFGVLAKVPEATADLRQYDSQSLVLIALATLWVGQARRAKELLSIAERSGSPDGSDSLIQVAKGLACRSLGQTAAALSHLQTAVKQAQDEGNNEQLAWAHLHSLRPAVDSQVHGAAALVPNARAAVYKSGSVQAMAYLHLVIAVLEGETGRVRESARHTASAASLLEREPNVWLQCQVLRIKANIAMASGRVDESLLFSRAGRDLARQHGLLRDEATDSINVGHGYLVRGDFDSSRTTLVEVVSSPFSSAGAKAAALHTLAQGALATGDLDTCERHLEEMSAAPMISGYLGRHGAITLSRLRLKRHDPRGAVAAITAPKADNRRYDWWPPNESLVLAVADVRLGDARDAAQQLVASEQAGATRLRDLQGQYYYTAAAATDAFDALLATQLRDRARRLWKHQGIVSLEREMEDIAPPKPVWKGAHKSPAIAINALGSTLDLSHAPRLLGDELVRTLKGLGVAATITAAEAPPTEGATTLVLGQENGCDLTLVCPIPDRPDAAVLAQDVLRVGRAAIELERFREDERQRTALWPEDPIEEQMGALFVSQEMRDLLMLVRRVAETTVPVLITGETGTGKEVIARIVHAYSPRAKTPLLAFNCASMPRDMIDSQLFGHRKGAFTGAVEHFPGVIRAADRGTLLLDEIGDMPMDVQPKLLRFLESHEVHPVGEARPTKVDVRVVAATNAKLSSLVSQGLFREDLYYRLNVVELAIPPLRDRRADIPVLADHYLKKYAAEYHKGTLRISEDAMEHLLLHKWPGNVRQLANEMRRAAAMAEANGLVMTQHFSDSVGAARRTVPTTERPPDLREVSVRLDQPIAAAMEFLERAMIRFALTKCDGRMEDTASLLGMSRKGLYLKRQRYALDSPGDARSATA